MVIMKNNIYAITDRDIERWNLCSAWFGEYIKNLEIDKVARRDLITKTISDFVLEHPDADQELIQMFKWWLHDTVRDEWLQKERRKREFFKKMVDEFRRERWIKISHAARYDKNNTKSEEDILKSKTLVDDILSSFHAAISGNDLVLRNLVYDIALEGAPPITVGDDDETVRLIRSHPAIWIHGSSGTGKGQMITLLERVSQNPCRVSDLTQSAFRSGILQDAYYGVILFPEAEAVYRENNRGYISATNLRLITQIRQLIEDGFMTFYEYSPYEMRSKPKSFYAASTLVMASTKLPEEEQTRQRFIIYSLERDLDLDLAVLDATALGVMKRWHNPTFSLDIVRLLYSAVYYNAIHSKGVIIPDKFANLLGGMNYRLVLLSMWKARKDLRDEIDSLIKKSRGEIGSAIVQYDWYNFIEENKKEIKSAPNHVRRQGDIIRRITASAYLHFLQRENKDGFIIAQEPDIRAGIELLEYIEKSEKLASYQKIV